MSGYSGGMQTIEYRDVVDKSKWDRGVWDKEPDKAQWPDTATSLPCLAVRNHLLGNWCGYVGVAEGHPAFLRGYEQLDSMDVHGGLTFAGQCQPGNEDRSICHTPDPGEPDHVWWLGFDCCHYLDLAPGLEAREREWDLPEIPGIPSDEYRPLEYVQAQCADLARQLAELTRSA